MHVGDVLRPVFFCNILRRYNRERLRFAQPGLWICKVGGWLVTRDVRLVTFVLEVAALQPVRSGRLLTD
jgi:hypothetical protein